MRLLILSLLLQPYLLMHIHIFKLGFRTAETSFDKNVCQNFLFEELKPLQYFRMETFKEQTFPN